MWNPFKKKVYNIFDDVSKRCNKCNKAFDKELKICPNCNIPLIEMELDPDRAKKIAVEYGDKGSAALSQPVFNVDSNSMELHVKGEKYPMRAWPRYHVLHGPMAPLKRYIKNLIIEQVVKLLPYKIPDENLAEPVREIARVFDLMVQLEDEPEMKRLMGQFKDAVTMILQEDDAWRYRLQWAAEQLDMKKFKLSEADKYYLRGKSVNRDMIK